MNYDTIITIICLIAAATTIAVSFRFAYWRNRAEKAENELLANTIRVGVLTTSNEICLRRAHHAEAALAKLEAKPAIELEGYEDHAIDAKSQSYGETIRKLFDASTLTFAGFNTVADMDVATLVRFGMAVKNGHIEKMLDQQAKLIRQIDALKGGAK